jgi:hypothetical protein
MSDSERSLWSEDKPRQRPMTLAELRDHAMNERLDREYARAQAIAHAERELVDHVMAVLEMNPQLLSIGTRMFAEKLKEARRGT